jgi:hypothetical protein
LKLSFKILLFFLISTFAIGFYFFGTTHEVICPTCDGTGQVWGTWFDFDAGTLHQGYLNCSNCDGSGKAYTPSSVSLALICFIIFVFGFLALFALTYFFSAFRLEANPWVKDVKDMEFLFNPMYFAWLFYVDRKKWVKWNTAVSLMVTVLLVAVFVLLNNPNQDSLAGFLIGTILTIPFAVAWYQNFENLFDFLM